MSYQYEAQPRDQYSVYNMTATQKLAFLQKVYVTFFMALLVSGVGAYVGMGMVKTVAQNYLAFFIVEIIACVAAFSLRRQPGINFAALFLFTFLSGLTLAPLFVAFIMAGKAMIIKEAFILTSVIFLGLTSYVFITKKDFSYLGGMLFMGLFGVFGFGIILLFFPASPMTNIIYGGFGALLFCGYVLYDTSRMLQEWEGNDYVGFALDLYLDFINLFLFILRILAAGDD